MYVNDAVLTAISSGWNPWLDTLLNILKMYFQPEQRGYILWFEDSPPSDRQEHMLPMGSWHWALPKNRFRSPLLLLSHLQPEENCLKTFFLDLCWKSLERIL